ncbi:DUF4158 domain-containing protein [Micromonospora schwarzwaldensis]|uniref:DUF4158 domain-containing protein n=1 Tax=Micromonospora sp. DSM 45708 TaxID=3111767 RepID=UPI0031DE4CCD
MRRDWDPEDLIAYWTLLDSDWELVANKTGVTRLGFVALLKFFEIEGRFPQYAAEVPEPAVSYLAEQVKVDPQLFADYRWSGRTIESHRAQIRAALGFRECSEADQQKLTEWLARDVCASEQLRDAVLAQCRVLHLEPPSFGQISRLAGSALTCSRNGSAPRSSSGWTQSRPAAVWSRCTGRRRTRPVAGRRSCRS